MGFPAKNTSSRLWPVSYLLTGLFYIGMPVVRTDGRSVGRACGHAITKISQMDGWARWITNFLRCVAPLSRVWSTDIIRCVGVIRCPTSLTSMLLGLKPKMRYCHLFCLKVIDMTMFKSFLSWICIRRLVTVGFSRLKNREESLRHVSRSHGSKISWWQPNRKFT